MAGNLRAKASSSGGGDEEAQQKPIIRLPGGAIDISRRRLSATVVFEWVCRAVGVMLGVAVVALLTRYLGPQRFGDLSLALALTGIAGAAADVGFKQSAIRQAALEPEARSDIAGTFVVVRGMFATLLFAIVGGIGILLAHDRETALLIMIIAAVLPLGFFSSAGFLLHVRLRNELYAAGILLQSALWLAVVVAASVGDWSLIAIGAGYFATSALQAAFTFWLAQRLVPFRFSLDRNRAKALLTTALPLTMAGLFMALNLRLDGVLIYEINGAADAGLYTSAYRILEQLSIVPAAIISLIAPLLANWLVTDPIRYRRIVSAFLRYLVLVALPITFAIFVLAQPLAELLFGPEFTSAGDYLAVLSLAFLGTAISALFFGAMVAAGEMRLIAGTQGLLLLGVALADLALLPRYGPMAAAIVTVFAEIVLAGVFYLHLLRKKLANPPSRSAFRILVPLASMLTLGLAALYAGPLPAALVGVAAFCSAAFAAKLITPQELRGLLSRDVVATI